MYRTLLLVLLYTRTALAAPQNNNDTTHVKIEPLDKEEQTQTTSTYRESSIENLPTTSSEFDSNGSHDSPFNRFEDSSYDSLSERLSRSEEITTPYSIETTETTEAATERDEHIDITDTDYEVKTKAPPRFYSKLSYFKKSNDFSRSVFTNLVERPERRKFRSRCRCERIWNCPKLQISVPRCPEEYFLCCF